MSMVGQSRSLEIFICMPKIRKPMVIRSTFLFSHWNRKSKTDNHVIVSSLAFNSETKIPSDSLCPTILILPHHILINPGPYLKKAVQLIPLWAGLRPSGSDHFFLVLYLPYKYTPGLGLGLSFIMSVVQVQVQVQVHFNTAPSFNSLLPSTICRHAGR